MPAIAASATSMQDHPSAPFIAADVGGTHVRLGVVQAGAEGAPPQVLAYSKYRCADHPGLHAILDDFIQRCGTPVREAVIASAGYPLADGTVITANLPWPLSPVAIRQALGLDAVPLINDFEALAHAAAQVDASQVLRLSGPDTPDIGPILILGPGTGLGAAVWIPTGKRPIVLPTEAGQAALAVGTELELQLLRHMLGQRSHVSVEQALSGPGLLNLYNAMCAVRGIAPAHAQPGEVTAAALDGGDPVARETLDVFCALLGSAVGDMALLYGAQGVFLAGGILPHLRQFLLHSDFVHRFLNKGPMREALERVSVKLVEHGQLGVIGAARWFLQSDFSEK